MNNYIAQIHDLGACNDSVFWLSSQNYPSARSAWNACEDPGWMSWLILRCCDLNESDQHKTALRMLCEFASCYIDPNISAAVDVVKQWCDGTLTTKEANPALVNYIAQLEYDEFLQIIVSGMLDCVVRVSQAHAARMAERLCRGYSIRRGRDEAMLIVRRYFPHPPTLTTGGQP